MQGAYLNYNGNYHSSHALIISAENRSFRYGDGFFETMKLVNGKILLAAYHFERLFSSLELLQFDRPAHFNTSYIETQIHDLARKNGHQQQARIRLMIFRGNGGLFDPENNEPNFIIQSWPAAPADHFNQEGLVMDIFPHARKTCDLYSPIKSNNYQPYAMAALWATKKQLDDAIILNAYDRIAEAGIANIFIVKDGVLKTPSLPEGCVSGVTRKYLLHCFHKAQLPVEEGQITVDELLQASEVFLTNAGYHIRWVKQVGLSNYTALFSAHIHEKFILPLYH